MPSAYTTSADIKYPKKRYDQDWYLPRGKASDAPEEPVNGYALPTIAIVFIAIGGVLIITLIIVFIVWWCRRQSDTNKEEEEGPNLEEREEPEGIDYTKLDRSDSQRPRDVYMGLVDVKTDRAKQTRSAYQSTKRRKENDYEIQTQKSWEYPRDNIIIQDTIGSGEFGKVMKAAAFGVYENDQWTTVAVKILKDDAKSNEKEELMREIKLMMKLPPHPNVVSLLGCCTDEDPIYLIMEYVSRGNLHDYLRKSKTNTLSNYKNLYPKSKYLTPRDLISFAWQIAQGMAFLSERECVHRDLAARNILIGEHKTCKISDFGFARGVLDTDELEKKTEGLLPIRWMAPESLLYDVYSTESDVWSYGILLWEIVTLGSTPYQRMSSLDIVDKVPVGYRMPKPTHCEQQIYDIMTNCWQDSPTQRPTFEDISEELEEMATAEKDFISLEDFEAEVQQDHREAKRERRTLDRRSVVGLSENV